MADETPKTLTEILGAAYGVHQGQRDRAAAIALVSVWLGKDDDRHATAQEELKRLDAFFRSQRRDHISWVYRDILRAALPT